MCLKRSPSHQADGANRPVTLDNESREIDADDVLAQWQACHTTYVVARAHSLCFPEYPDNVENDLHAGMMGMKTMTASAASKEFGLYMDTVQREPVIITKQNRPVAITLSIQQAERLLQGQVEAGIASGLEDVAAGRYVKMTPSHLEALRERFQARIR